MLQTKAHNKPLVHCNARKAENKMINKPYTKILLLALVPLMSCSEQHTSEYVGEENREIKSLSSDDITALKKGSGWGLAKAAELNGYPGPIHILEMESEIDLTESQKRKIEKLYKKMNGEAVVLGEQLIDIEKALSKSFYSQEIDPELLESYVHEAGSVHAKLRFVHLSAHLETPRILSTEQVSLYNDLRGYSSDDPCSNVPKGHNAAMWKKHNGCE